MQDSNPLATQSINKPNPTPCAGLVWLVQTRIEPSSDVTSFVVVGKELFT
ncbi:hypothetical protein NC651_002453 [Populus alba x Populus x berolinensis]|nr:hypothetical protein NC651_002453 [Populus alba x Populus x berolinensis]